MDSATGMGVGWIRGRLVRSPQAGPEGPGNSLPVSRLDFSSRFSGLPEASPAAATWLWLMGALSAPPQSHEDGAPAGQPGLHGQPA